MTKTALLVFIVALGCGGTPPADPASDGTSTAGSERPAEDDQGTDSGDGSRCGGGGGGPCGQIEIGDEGETGETTETAPPADGPTEPTATETPTVDGAGANDFAARVAAGRAVFSRRCVQCHTMRGEEDIGPAIRGKRFTVARMERQIRRGSGRMRPIPPRRLSDLDMGELMYFLASLRAVTGIEPPG